MMTAATIVVGGALAGVNSVHQTAPHNNSGNLTEYYFEFTGQDGQEDQTAMWQEITQQEYNLTPCEEQYRGCALITTSVSADSNGELHPDQVDVNTASQYNKSPKIGNGVTEVKNRTDSY